MSFNFEDFYFMLHSIQKFNGDPNRLENFVYQLRQISIECGWDAEYYLMKGMPDLLERKTFLAFAESVTTYKSLEAFLEDLFMKFGDITYNAGKQRYLRNIYPENKSAVIHQEYIPESYLSRKQCQEIRDGEFIKRLKYIINAVKNNTKCSYENIETLININAIRDSYRELVYSIFGKREPVGHKSTIESEYLSEGSKAFIDTSINININTNTNKSGNKENSEHTAIRELLSDNDGVLLKINYRKLIKGSAGADLLVDEKKMKEVYQQSDLEGENLTVDLLRLS